jgi:hypothetical protein
MYDSGVRQAEKANFFENLKELLKEHLEIRIDTESEPHFYKDGGYTEVKVKVVFAGEVIDSDSFSFETD